MTSLGVYGIVLGGWASNSKYPLMGAMRSSAQMISYELSLTLSVVGVLMIANTLSLAQLVTSQQSTWLGFIPRWNIFLQPVAFARLSDQRDRRNESLAVRSGRIRTGTGRRLAYRIQFHEVRRCSCWLSTPI